MEERIHIDTAAPRRAAGQLSALIMNTAARLRTARKARPASDLELAARLNESGRELSRCYMPGRGSF